MPSESSSTFNAQNEAPSRRLDSWKEIAAYLGRGERTAKRWESERALPVHRLPGGGRGSVYAYTAELDEWLNSAADEVPEMAAEAGPVEESSKEPERPEPAEFLAELADPAASEIPARSGRRGWSARTSAYALVLIGLAAAMLLFNERGCSRRRCSRANDQGGPPPPKSKSLLNRVGEFRMDRALATFSHVLLEDALKIRSIGLALMLRSRNMNGSPGARRASRRPPPRRPGRGYAASPSAETA